VGAEKFLPEKYLDSARKNCYATLPDSPLTVTIRKNPGFRALHLVARIPKKGIFLNFGSWLLPEKRSVCPKTNGFVLLRGTAPLAPGSRWSASVEVSRRKLSRRH